MYTHTLPIIHTLSIIYFLPETMLSCLPGFFVQIQNIIIPHKIYFTLPSILTLYISSGNTRSLVCSFKDFPLCKRIQSPAAAHFQSFLSARCCKDCSLSFNLVLTGDVLFPDNQDSVWSSRKHSGVSTVFATGLSCGYVTNHTVHYLWLLRIV